MSTNIQLGDKISFIKLFSQTALSVRIPIIQRDYAQGRASAYEVRKAFLTALLTYLRAEGTHDLDFVYGAVSEGQDFLPLDGQQRLTTLFLLHWYLAQISDNSEARATYYDCMFTDQKVRFSYETRPSAREFCQALLTHTQQSRLCSESGKPLSALIKEQAWYFLSWDRDPTITAMLTMLDDIHQLFAEEHDGLSKLLDEDNPRLCFKFLDLKGFGLTDDLYIKMNGRGKALTPIESFKASLEQYLRSELQDKTRANDFAYKMDRQWADLMWCYREKQHTEHASDAQWERVFQNLLSYSYALNQGVGKDGELGRLHRKFRSFNVYKELGCINQQSLDFISSVLNVLYNGENKIRECLLKEFRPYFSAEDYWTYLLTNQNWTYNARLIFYAYVAYLIKFQPEYNTPEDIQALSEWMRVVHNCYRGENLQIDNEQDYVRALKGLSKMIELGQPIYQLLSDGYSPDGVAGYQIAEEQHKARLLLSDSATWWVLIRQAELHPYFLGQIGFLLDFSDNNPQLFQRYEALSSKLFEGGYDKRPCKGYLLERAMLTKGDYVKLSGEKRRANLLSTNKGQNVYRDHSWRRMLRSEGSEARRLFKVLLDDTRLQPNEEINLGLERIIQEDWLHLEGENLSFRRALIKHPQIIATSGYGFVQRTNEEHGYSCRVVTKQQLSSYNYELQSYALYLDKFEGCDMQAYKPFNKVEYKCRKGYELPWIELTAFGNNGVDHSVCIQHQIDNAKGEDVWSMKWQEKSANSNIPASSEPGREFSTTEELFKALDEYRKNLVDL